MSKTIDITGLTGVVERLTYHSSESGYTVARVKVPKFSDLVTVVGSFANIQPGQTLKIKGYWREHPQYGQQFNALEYSETEGKEIIFNEGTLLQLIMSLRN